MKRKPAVKITVGRAAQAVEEWEKRAFGRSESLVQAFDRPRFAVPPQTIML